MVGGILECQKLACPLTEVVDPPITGQASERPNSIVVEKLRHLPNQLHS
jgi:hypothetical protein